MDLKMIIYIVGAISGIVLITAWIYLRAEKSRRGQLDAIISSMAEGLIAVDHQGRILMMNQAAGVLLKRAPNDCIGNDISCAFELIQCKKKQKTAHWLLKNVIQNQDVINMSLGDQCYTTDSVGHLFPIAMTAAPLVHDTTIGALILFRDITKITEVDRAKTEFVSLAAHQLRTPLSSIKWYTEALLLGNVGRLSKEQVDYVESIHSSNQRMISLVNSLLNVARIDLGTFAVSPEPTQLPDIIQKIQKEIAPSLREKNITLVSNIPATFPSVLLDAGLFRIIVENLLTNAVKYTPNGGTITIQLKKTSDTAHISVTDTGVGIPKRQQDKIFTKLFRADNVKTQDTSGTGLGLYLVKSILDQTGGTITFTSQEGTGTTFTVSFPLSGMKAKKGVAIT